MREPLRPVVEAGSMQAGDREGSRPVVYLMTNGEGMRGGSVHHTIADQPFVGERETALHHHVSRPGRLAHQRQAAW